MASKVNKSFEVREHEEYGELGWALDKHPHFDPIISGVTFAHDILEHVLNGDGLNEEIAAFGVIAWGRWLTRHNPNLTLESLGEELGQLVYRAYEDSGETVTKCAPRFYKDMDYNHIGDDDLRVIARHVHTGMVGEHEERGWGEDDALEAPVPEVEDVLAWLRKGAIAAEKKYQCPYALTDMFKTLHETYDKVLHREVHEATSLRVSVNLDTWTATIKTGIPDYENGSDKIFWRDSWEV